MIPAHAALAAVDLSPEYVLYGLIVGSTYGILAVGLVLIYRSNRIVNFAHGEIGAFGGACCGYVVINGHVPYWIALAGAVALSALVGAIVETAVVRRLRSAPRVMSVIATLGVGQFLFSLQGLVNSNVAIGAPFPQPDWIPELRVASLILTPAFIVLMVVTPLTMAGLAAFLRFTSLGNAMRAAAANPDAALLSGIFAARMSTIAWALAGGVACLTATLLLPTYGGFSGVDLFGPDLLLRALAAAMVGRMVNLPVAFAAGIVLGMVERLLTANHVAAGSFDLVLFLAILAALLFLRPRGSREEDRGSVWASVASWGPLPDAYRGSWLIRRGAALGWLGALGLAALLPQVVSFQTTVQLISIYVFAIAGLSVGLLSGLAGQLSLGQFAIAGIGGTAAAATYTRTQDFPLALLLAALAGAGTSIVVGLPALRIRGVMLAVSTLAFALMARNWLLHQSWMLGDSTTVSRPRIGTLDLAPSKSFYYAVLAGLALAVLVTRQIWRGGIGRIMVALRDNEDGARAFTIAATARKLQAFGLAGGVAGLAGALFAFTAGNLTDHAFSPALSIDVLATAVIGGIGLLAGPIIGALYIFGIPDFVPIGSAGLAATSLGWLLLVLYFPGGVAAVLRPLRDRVARVAARLGGVDVEAADAAERSVRAASAGIPVEAMSLRAVTAAPSVTAAASGQGSPLLVAEGLTKRYGGLLAVNDVSITVLEGETLGLIGPNGAGKTTLFELISGFTRPDAGSIVFDGHPLTRRLRVARASALVSVSPERRAHLGLIRSFQDAALFPTMTVEDAVMLAQERTGATRLLPSMMGSDEGAREKRERAGELIAAMGLEPYRRRPVGELSTGTRRVAELCCLLALRPRLLLLDEPSSGIAQRETEALGGLLRTVKQHLGTTMVVIEHDIPLIMGLSDRVIAMEAGAVIATGTPDQVRADRAVIDSYLGGDLVAIERSGPAAVAAGVA